jgi:hypothetical protein
VTNFLGKEKSLRKMFVVDEQCLTDAPTEFSNSFIDKGSTARIPFELFGGIIKQQIGLQICRLTSNEAIEFIGKMATNKAFHAHYGWFSPLAIDALRSFIVDLISKKTKEFIQSKGESILYKPAPNPNFDPTYFDQHWPVIEAFLLEEEDNERMVEIDPNNLSIPIEVQWLKKYRQIERLSGETTTDMEQAIPPVAAPVPSTVKASQSSVSQKKVTIAQPSSSSSTVSRPAVVPQPKPIAQPKSVQEVSAYKFFQESDSEEDD